MPSKPSGPPSGANDDQAPTVDATDTTDTGSDTQPDQVTVTAQASAPEPEQVEGSPYDLVRVRSTKSGNEHTVTRVMADKNDDLKVLEGKPATNSFGKPIPARAKPTNRTNKAGTPVQEA